MARKTRGGGGGTPRRGRRARRILLVTSLVLVIALAAGAAAAYRFDLVDRWLGEDAPPAAVPPPPGFTLAPQPSPRTPARPAPRTDRVTGPTEAEVRRALGDEVHDRHLGDLSVVVAPLGGPYDAAPVLRDGRGLVTPASTLKLLTAAAALEALGPDRTFATRVVGRGRNLTLVGGGDPFLAGEQPTTGPARHDASLQTLAQLTAKALHRKGIRQVQLAYDTSLFTGPTVDPAWPKHYIPDDVVTPITALWADEGLDPNGFGRVADPPATAAATFAAYLAKNGIKVTGAPREHTAPAHAHEVARVTSLPVSDIVERTLQYSDNEGAEVLGHQVGLEVAGEGSYAGGVRGVQTTLQRLGIDLRGARLYDGSGLSRHDRLDPRTILDVLRLSASADHPELRSVLSGLPVAAFDGSLADRFDDSSGRGWVRAKTGTLTGTSALAGLATTRRDHVLAFALVSNHIRLLDTLDARAALDDLAARLADCNC